MIEIEEKVNLYRDEFKTVFGVKKNIPALREKVLDFAIRGKLVEQDPNDEPVIQLVGRINKFRHDNKLNLKFLELEKKEIPFEIPKSWTWMRLGQLTTNFGQKKPGKTFTYIDVSAIDNKKGQISENITILEPQKAPSRARKLVGKGAVIYSTVRPYLLNVAVIDKTFTPEPIVSTAFSVLKPLDGFSEYFLYYYLRSNTFINYVEDKMVGLTYPAINDKNLQLGIVPIPPINEQKRIVEQIQLLWSQIDKLEEQLEEKEKLETLIPKAVVTTLSNSKDEEELKKNLALVIENFAEVFKMPESLEEFRGVILRLGIQGKLLPQEPSDIPVGGMLEDINKIKNELVKSGMIKKEKRLSMIDEDEVPFSIPVNWEWVRMGEIASKVHYGYTASAATAGSAQMLRITDIQNGKVDWGHVPYCIIEDEKIEQYILKENDIVIARTGGTVGKSFIVRNLKSVSVFASYLIRIVLVNPNLADYVNLYLDSPYYWNEIGIQSKGTGQPNVNAKQLSNLLVPLPPLEEQKRIVAKIESLFAVVDQLEKEMKRREHIVESMAVI